MSSIVIRVTIMAENSRITYAASAERPPEKASGETAIKRSVPSIKVDFPIARTGREVGS